MAVPENIGVVIPAAGRGVRFGSTIPKQYLQLNGLPVIVHTLRTVLSLKTVRCVVVPLSATDTLFDHALRSSGLSDPRIVTVEGGSERQHSINAALYHPAINSCDVVLVHDAVRPLASTRLFERVAEAAATFGAAIPVREVQDTIKRVEEGVVKETIVRSELRYVQTPQGFRTDVLKRAYERSSSLTVTDDASLVEALGEPVTVVDGEPWNIKLTTPTDLEIASVLLTRN